MRHLVLASAAAAAIIAAAPEARACTVTGSLVTYYKPTVLPLFDTRCDLDSADHCTKLELKGYLYTPPPPPPGQVGQVALFPLLVFNHGSEETPGDKCDVGEYFSTRGYVVFVPHRRGHGKSTGVYLDQYNSDFCSVSNAGACKMEYLRKQVDDVSAAVTYMKGLTVGLFGPKLVNADKIVFMGHSFGGIVTIFANEKQLGQKAVISVAGASQSWEGNPSAVSEMVDAVEDAIAPMYFVEPMNDHSIRPTIELAQVAGLNCKQYQSAIFPPSEVTGDGLITLADYEGDWDGDGKTFDPRDAAHGAFTGSRITEWGPSALEFYTRYLALPAKLDKLCLGTSVGDD
jgi:pimeloyl-ACP methyl ester carboxylesterase